MKKLYHGLRTDKGCIVSVEYGKDASLLPMRLDLENHSPTGAEWGYTGSGPAQLALALLADALGDGERAQHLYQDFKLKVVSRIPHEGWTLTEDEIRQTAVAIERDQQSRGVRH